MLTFLLGLSLGACIGAAALGICLSSYEHESSEDAPPPRTGDSVAHL